MNHPSSYDFSGIEAGDSLAVVSPGNLTDMKHYCREFQRFGIPYLFSPGQSLSRWDADDLVPCLKGAAAVIVNRDELAAITGKTGLTAPDLAGEGGALIVTLGGEGSAVRTPDRETAVPAAQPERIIDSHGAGDAFTGGLAEGILEGKTMLESAMTGAVCASFSLEFPGTQDYGFSREAFDARLAELRNNVSG
jgi:adenosine kinase